MVAITVIPSSYSDCFIFKLNAYVHLYIAWYFREFILAVNVFHIRSYPCKFVKTFCKDMSVIYTKKDKHDNNADSSQIFGLASGFVFIVALHLFRGDDTSFL